VRLADLQDERYPEVWRREGHQEPILVEGFELLLEAHDELGSIEAEPEGPRPLL